METVAPIEDLAQVATRWQDTMLSLEKEYEQESEVLKIGEVAIGTLGNFSASIGKAKSKKTFNVSAMVAAALSEKEVLNYTTDFPEGKNRILYIDTEQSQNHCMIVMHRIMKLAELPANEDCDRFYFLALRKFNPKYNPQIQISAESETKRSIFREKDKTKRSKKESAQHSKSRNKSFVMTSVSAL